MVPHDCIFTVRELTSLPFFGSLEFFLGFLFTLKKHWKTHRG